MEFNFKNIMTLEEKYAKSPINEPKNIKPRELNVNEPINVKSQGQELNKKYFDL